MVEAPPQTRCPKLNPKAGDCLIRFGTKYQELFRFVTKRDNLSVTFVTGEKSKPKLIWLPTWQDWAANGSDVVQHSDNPGCLGHEELFIERRAIDRETRKKLED